MLGRLTTLLKLFVGICVIGMLIWALTSPEGAGGAVGSGFRAAFDWISSFFDGADVSTPDVNVE